jgi:hypothetical protein
MGGWSSTLPVMHNLHAPRRFFKSLDADLSFIYRLLRGPILVRGFMSRILVIWVSGVRKSLYPREISVQGPGSDQGRKFKACLSTDSNSIHAGTVTQFLIILENRWMSQKFSSGMTSQISGRDVRRERLPESTYQLILLELDVANSPRLPPFPLNFGDSSKTRV